MSGQIERLRRTGHNMALFWVGIMCVGLAISTFAAFVGRPELLHDWRGPAILVLVAAFAAWYWFGFRVLGAGKASFGMMSRDNDEYWRQCFGGAERRIHWQSVAYWAVMLAINLALIAFDANFKWVLFAVYGISMFVMTLPQSLWLTVPTVAVIFITLGWIPRSFSPEDWVGFLSGLLIFVIYSATAYMPIFLIRSRFARERMFEQLAQSHRELEEAHQQLAEAAVRDRELAVLRERARLGRDMHDTLGHSLALVAVKLEAAQRLRPVDPDRADHEVVATQTIAREALSELRAAIANLRGPLVASISLGEALSRDARDAAARASWQIVCDVASEASPREERAYEALLRVGSEALANAERHAAASAVRLSLVREGDDVVLRVRDDGVGILATNPPRVASAVRAGAVTADGMGAAPQELSPASPGEISSPNGHYGITGMRERITSLGGQFAIGPDNDGRGTLVEARIPAADHERP